MNYHPFVSFPPEVQDLFPLHSGVSTEDRRTIIQSTLNECMSEYRHFWRIEPSANNMLFNKSYQVPLTRILNFIEFLMSNRLCIVAITNQPRERRCVLNSEILHECWNYFERRCSRMFKFKFYPKTN